MWLKVSYKESRSNFYFRRDIGQGIQEWTK